MGYTHYFGFKSSKIDKEKFSKAVELFKKCLDACPKEIEVELYKYTTDETGNFNCEVSTKKVPFVLKGGDGEGKPVITDTKIVFNGNGKEDLDHETFLIRNDMDYREFCKTARKPYDLAVCLCLLAFKKVFGDDFEYSSDGNTREFVEGVKNGTIEWEENWGECKVEKEWQDAYDIFDGVVGKVS